MEKVRYEEMLPHEIVARRKKFPAAFIGLGGLEWHGEHLAVGNDALKAEKLCELAARQSGGFAFPTLWYGEPRVAGLMEANHDEKGGIRRAMGFKKAKWTPKHFGKDGAEQIAFYQELLRHVLIQMSSLEMKAVCLLCGHYPIHTWASPVVERFNREFGDTRVFAGIEFHYAPKDPKVGGDHAAHWETSYLWYLRPDCVDLSVFRGREGEELVGVMGKDPRTEASVEIGRAACERIVNGMVRKARQLVTSVKGKRR
ncbi:MAG TPA: creatininase family protein [Phycisphaerae bacterium]|nr:creatininase family protein [Phycisphaerae bacterium]